ncbi:MAG: hypothetical protein ACLQQ4_01290 [Bacteroidia bacterium]
MQNKVIHREKQCPKCSTAFTCSTVDCWCSRLPQVIPMNPEAGCLCPACLQKAIDEKIAKTRAES